MQSILHPFKWADSANGDFKQFVRLILVSFTVCLMVIGVAVGLMAILTILWEWNPALFIGPVLGLVGAFIRWVTLP